MKRALHHLLFVLAAGTALFIVACQTNTPNSPISDTKVLHPTDRLNFLTTQKANFAKNMVNERFISADEGGTIVIGDEEVGYSSIHFMPGDLSEDALITFSWDVQGHVAEFSPHGLNFNNPVALNLFYGNASLSGMNENNIRIWYFDETENAWELVSSEVNQAEKRVEGFVRHFSKYALAAED